MEMKPLEKRFGMRENHNFSHSMVYWSFATLVRWYIEIDDE